MRFSLIHFPRSPGAAEDGAIIDAMVEQSLWADEAGFDGVFLPEHHFTGYSPMSSDPFQFAGHLAPQLKNAYLGIAIVVVPAHHPVRLVEQMNLLDQLTKGRVIFGVGSGGLAEEVIGFGVRMADQTGAMLDENLDIAMRLWGKRSEDPPVTFETDYYRGSVVDRIMPAPYRSPHPLLAGVAMREQSIQRTARNGWPAFLASFGGRQKLVGRLRSYREALAAAGHSPEVLAECMGWTTLSLQCVQISETDEQAHADLMVTLEGMQRTHERRAAYYRQASEIAGVDPTLKRPSYTSQEYIDAWCVYGTPDRVAEQLRPYVEMGIGNLMLSFNNTHYDAEARKVSEKSLRLFTEEVMPRFHDVPTPVDPLEIELAAPAERGDPQSPPGPRID